MDKITFEKFTVEDACQILGSNDEIDTARINLVTGPAYSAFLNNELVACGGVRVLGIGEAWALYDKKALEKKLSLLKHSKAWLNRIIRDEKLWRIWSECPEPKPNQNFLEHMKFRQLPAFLRG